MFTTETPPLTRRKQLFNEKLDRMLGNTSAYAEKTELPAHDGAIAWKHLRLRGEN